ncbi:ATP-binding protein [Variovorax sp. LjRoot84]|uniref:sensor histidine kinase n=1 Tax=Variovorax sp. LjRoot84 TaxID=3342340 RepID=UPI003ECF7AC0
MLSLRTRLALAYLAVIVFVVAVTAFGAHWSLSRAVHGQLDAALLALAETEMAMLPRDTKQPATVHDPSRETTAPPSLVRLDRLVQIVNSDGHVVARSANLGEATLPAPAALLARLAAGETVFETLEGFGEEPVRMVSVPAPGHGPLLAVQVAGSLDDVNNVVGSASILFVVMGLALLLAVGTAGALLTRGAFQAIGEVVQQAHRIGEASMSERLPHPGTQDEIGRLVDTLNEMLSRLEQGFEAQRRFTADASHELRSPLSRLRTELEVALRRPRDAAAYVDALRSCMEEVERLTLLVEELLVLARIDAGQERGPVETVSLNELAEEAVRRLQPMARERQIEIVLAHSQPVTASVARGAASLVLANLLDNAVKFSVSGQRVTVDVASEGADAIVRVSDRGPGLRLDELPHLFERFYRGSTARSEQTSGVGLGLAISQAIVGSYGGRIDASNLPDGGAVFAIRLPRNV